ncbi:hypothetical protein [Agromyces humi]|uniref:hypothetical protein n=1 Tax=Agromyces humi TaxID=1766800 RepID=UPI00135B3399|nr:hypothetical protein [Agromyces humi]
MPETPTAEQLQARIDNVLAALAYHQLMESNVIDVRTPNGWVDIADLLGEEQPTFQWGTAYDVDSTTTDYEAAESEEAARAAVAASPSDTGLVIRTVTGSGRPLDGWRPAR